MHISLVPKYKLAKLLSSGKLTKQKCLVFNLPKILVLLKRFAIGHIEQIL